MIFFSFRAARKAKAQAAMEFLLSYGWIILAVLLAIGALVYFGILSSEKLLPERCILPQGFYCADHKVTPNEVVLVVENSGFSGFVAIKSINFTNYPNCGANFDIELKKGERKTFIISCNSQPGTKFISDIDVIYRLEGSLIDHNGKGHIIAWVERLVVGDRCSDGTLYGACAVNKPLYCDNGILSNNCSLCGCEYGYGCQQDGSCLELEKCLDGTYYGYCSATKPLYCDNGILSNNCSLCGCQEGRACHLSGYCYVPEIPGDETGGAQKTLTSLSDGSTTKDLTFYTAETQRVYLKLPKNAKITTASLELTGLAVDTYSVSSIKNADNLYLGYDNDWSTRTDYIEQQSAGSGSIENYARYFENYNNSIGAAGNIEVTYKVGGPSGVYYTYYYYVDLWNYSLGDWAEADSETADWGEYIMTFSFSKPMSADFVSNGETKLRLRARHWAWGEPWYMTAQMGVYEVETRVNGNVLGLLNAGASYPGSPTLHVGGSRVWSHSGAFSTTETASGFSAQIESYLSGCSADSAGNCLVPLDIYSGAEGIIRISGISVVYTS